MCVAHSSSSNDRYEPEMQLKLPRNAVVVAVLVMVVVGVVIGVVVTLVVRVVVGVVSGVEVPVAVRVDETVVVGVEVELVVGVVVGVVSWHSWSVLSSWASMAAWRPSRVASQFPTALRWLRSPQPILSSTPVKPAAARLRMAATASQSSTSTDETVSLYAMHVAFDWRVLSQFCTRSSTSVL